MDPLAVVVGIGLFAVYAKYYYKPIASVTDYYKEMHGENNEIATAGQMGEEKEYLPSDPRRILDTRVRSQQSDPGEAAIGGRRRKRFIEL